MNLTEARTGELLIGGQALIIRSLVDVDPRSIGEQIIEYQKSRPYEIPGDKIEQGIRKVVLSPSILNGDLPEVTAVYTDAIVKLRQIIPGLDDWTSDRQGLAGCVRGHIVDPGGGFNLHRDQTVFKKIVAVVNLMSKRDITLVQAEDSDERSKDVPRFRYHRSFLDEGDCLVMDADSRPHHATENRSRQVGVTMPILEMKFVPIINVEPDLGTKHIWVKPSSAKDSWFKEKIDMLDPYSRLHRSRRSRMR